MVLQNPENKHIYFDILTGKKAASIILLPPQKKYHHHYQWLYTPC
jgi:hypothetical protein